MAEPTVREAKLIQYLNEAHGKERELETALQAHIAMTTRDAYRKRLQEHLRETKRQAKDLERRVKKLGGTPGPAPVPDAVAGAALKAQSAVNKAAAAAQGPLHMVRGTGEAEKMLKNAKTEFSDEAEEIATYHAIETLAAELHDRETAQLARRHRREEERMAKFLERLIPQLTKAVVKDEIPAAERRNGAARTRRRSSSRKSSGRTKASAASRGSSSRSASGSRAKSGARKRSSGAGKRAASSR